jgi:hypothetical protein
MKKIVLQYDTALTASPLGTSITCDSLAITCDVEHENVSEFISANDVKYVDTIGRYVIHFELSASNFEYDDAKYVAVKKFVSAPVRRIKIITSSSLTSLNGYTEFNTDNTINMIIESSDTIYNSNHRYRNVRIKLVSESTYII